MIDPLSDASICWRDQATWRPRLTSWLRPRLVRGAIKRLRRPPVAKLYPDDSEWTARLSGELRDNIDDVSGELADDLMSAVLHAFHACRVLDAGSFHREGLKLNIQQYWRMRCVESAKKTKRWLVCAPAWKPAYVTILLEIATLAGSTSASTSLFVLDSGHYLLYGSEWIQVLLGPGARQALRRRGSPTVVEIQMPLRVAFSDDRAAFASKLPQEWSCQESEGDGQSSGLDFTFDLRRDIPPAWVIGHSHPPRIQDPFHSVVSVKFCNLAWRDDHGGDRYRSWIAWRL